VLLLREAEGSRACGRRKEIVMLEAGERPESNRKSGLCRLAVS